jgi:hypothetical protein
MKRGQTQFKTMLHKIIYNDLTHQLHILIDFVIDYTRKNLTSCSKSANKPSTSCVRTACPKLSTSMEQVVNSCNNLAGIIRLVVRSHLVASLPTSRQQVVFALLVPSCQQVWNKLLTVVTTLLVLSDLL